jgi:hypothetical protein
MNTEAISFEPHEIDEQTALLFAITGRVIQEEASRGLLNDQRGSALVPYQRLYKVLANVIWDWYWLPKSLFSDHRLFLPIPALRWTPHRFGALGLISPLLDYPVRRRHGWVDFADLIRCGIFKRYKIQFDPARGAFAFPPVPAELRAGGAIKDETDRHRWETLSRIYALCGQEFNVETLDALASCRTGTAAFHSLWVQVIVWKQACRDLAALLRDSVDPFSDNEDRWHIEDFLEREAAAAANFSRKIRYWNQMADYFSRVAPIFADSEFKGAPTRLQSESCRWAGMVDAIRPFEKILESADKVVRGASESLGFRPLALRDAPTVPAVTPTEAAVADENLRRLTGGPVTSLDEISKTWFRLQRSEVALLIERHMQIVDDMFRTSTGLDLPDYGTHISRFAREYYPLSAHA